MVTASKNTVHSVFFFNPRFHKYFMSFYYDWGRVFRDDYANCLCRSCSSFIFVCCNAVSYTHLRAHETREELYYTKDKLLDNGDRWENILEANIKADSSHR